MERTAPDIQEVNARIREKNEDDRQQAKSLILLAIPFTVVVLLFFSALLFSLLFLLIGFDVLMGPAFLLCLAVVSIVVTIDVWRHPSEHWFRAEYYLVGGGTAHPRDSMQFFMGSLHPMPLMTNLSDPGNWATHGRLMSSGCSNIVLGGPRNIRKGFELYSLIRRRSRKENAAAAMSFVGWISKHGPLPIEELPTRLKDRPELVSGFGLADELGFLLRRNEGGKTLVSISGRD